MDSIKEILMNVLRRVKNQTLRKEYNALSPAKKDSIVIDLRYLNIKRLVVFEVILIIAELINLVRLIAITGDTDRIVFHIVITLALIIYMVFIDFTVKHKKAGLYQIIYLFFWGSFFVVYFFLNYIDNITLSCNELLSLSIVISVCIIPVLSTSEYIYLVVLQAIIIFIVFMYQDDGIFSNIQIIFSCMIAFIFSRVNYNAYLQLQINEKRLEEVNSGLQDLALRDSLTGLLNRRGLDDKLEVLWPLCIREGQSAVIVMLDIDYFKQYNDTYGHVEGDRCLREVADAIKHAAKRRSDVIARVGGEEFLVFAHNVDASQALILANEIKDNIKLIDLNKDCGEKGNKVTVSIGVAVVVPNRESEFIELYEKADKCLYQAKETGRNCIVINNK